MSTFDRRRGLIAALGLTGTGLIGAAIAKPKHDGKPKHTKHDEKKHDEKKSKKHGGEHDHMTFDHPETDAEITPAPEVDVTPEPTADVDVAPQAKLTRKQKKRQRSDDLSLSATTTAPPGPVLIKRYGFPAQNGIDRYNPRGLAVGLTKPDVEFTQTWRVTDPGAYADWDVFAFGGFVSGFKADPILATFQARRPVTVGYAWRRPGTTPPAFLAADGWQLSGSIKAATISNGAVTEWPVYRKNFPAGDVTIKGANNRLPWLLFAEADGQPSSGPSVPSGLAVPQPNAMCPSWVHDKHTSADGFPLGHSAIDDEYWCYFGHEHGSDEAPACPGQTCRIRFGTAAKKMGMTENHHGYKRYTIKLQDGKWLLVMGHFGTTGVLRANTCLQQFHEVYFELRSGSGELLAIRNHMADFGRSGGCQIQDTCNIPLNPTTCPTGNADTGYTSPGQGMRQLPVTPFGLNSQAYEPWLTAIYKVLGFSGGKFVMNTVDGIDICPNDGKCDTGIRTAKGTGTGRFLTFNKEQDTGVNRTFGIKQSGRENSNGKYWTDPLGKQFRNATDADAVEQYTKPGFSWQMIDFDLGHWGGTNVAVWGDPVIKVPTGQPGDAEGSIYELTRRSQNPSAN